MCSDCAAGTYASVPGEECSQCLPGKSTNGLSGQSACLECQAGRWQEGKGGETCDECPVNFYSAAGSTGCTACEAGKSTNSLKGSAECTVPPSEDGGSAQSELDIRSREGVLNVFRTGMAYMITLLFCIAFAVFGYLIMASRVKNARLCALPLPLVLTRMAMVAISMISEIFMTAVMFAEGTLDPFFTMLGVVVVSFRACNVVPTSLILFAVFGGECFSCTEKYKRCFDKVRRRAGAGGRVCSSRRGGVYLAPEGSQLEEEEEEQAPRLVRELRCDEELV